MCSILKNASLVALKAMQLRQSGSITHALVEMAVSRAHVSFILAVLLCLHSSSTLSFVSAWPEEILHSGVFSASSETSGSLVCEEFEPYPAAAYHYISDRQLQVDFVAGGGAGATCDFNDVYPWTLPLNAGGAGGGGGAYAKIYLPPLDTFDCGRPWKSHRDYLTNVFVGRGGGTQGSSSLNGHVSAFCFGQYSPLDASEITVCCELDGGKVGQGNTGGKGGGFMCLDTSNITPHVLFYVAEGGAGGTLSSPNGGVGQSYTHTAMSSMSPSSGQYVRNITVLLFAGSGGGYGGSATSAGGDGGLAVIQSHGQGDDTRPSGGGGGGTNHFNVTELPGNIVQFESKGACTASPTVYCATYPTTFDATFGGGGRGGCNSMACASPQCGASSGGNGRLQYRDHFFDVTPTPYPCNPNLPGPGCND